MNVCVPAELMETELVVELQHAGLRSTSASIQVKAGLG